MWILGQFDPFNDQYWMEISAHPDKDTRRRLMAGQGHVSRGQAVLQACVALWGIYIRLEQAQHGLAVWGWMLLLQSCGVSYVLIAVSGQ